MLRKLPVLDEDLLKERTGKIWVDAGGNPSPLRASPDGRIYYIDAGSEQEVYPVLGEVVSLSTDGPAGEYTRHKVACNRIDRSAID